MRADLLDVVVPMTNPLRWKVREKQFAAFVKHMKESGVRLTLVECAFGDRPHMFSDIDGINFVGVRSRTLCWNKENLINIGIAHLRPDWEYVCWPDADIVFRDPQWASETVHALQHYGVVQNWSEAVSMGPDGQALDLFHSFCKRLSRGDTVFKSDNAKWDKDGGSYPYPHPGYSWSATRDVIERVGGLFELGVSGSGDHHMAYGLCGKIAQSVPQMVRDRCPSLLKHMQVWEKRAVHHVNENLGYVRGVIEHSFHGRPVDRKYWSRWSIFTDNGFDPDTDLKRNSHGVIELAGNKPGLRRDIDNYMRSRAEDSNVA